MRQVFLCFGIDACKRTDCGDIKNKRKNKGADIGETFCASRLKIRDTDGWGVFDFFFYRPLKRNCIMTNVKKSFFFVVFHD